MRLFDSSILYWNNQQDAYSKAECYREGRLVKQSMPRALALYHQAAQAGDSRAYFRLGEYYQQNNQKNYAFSAFYTAAIGNNLDSINVLQSLSNNDTDAALLLGKIYIYKKQYTQAISAYRKAHELKHPDGMYHIAKLFGHLSNTEKQGKELADYYRDAIKAGSKHALDELIQLSATSGKASFYVAHMYEHNLKQIERALPFYEKASQQRFGEATYILGNIYAQGPANIAIDIAKACRYYMTASQQGYHSSISLLQSLAQQGHAEAQYVLGYEYYRNRNDISSAVIWCLKAEAQGHQAATSYLRGDFSKEIYWEIAETYISLQGNSKKNQAKAVEFSIKASDLGLVNASLFLAKIFYQGNKSINRDIVKAYHYFIIAGKQGDLSALNTLEKYATTGDKEAQFALADYYSNTSNIEKAIHWYVKAEIQGHKKARTYLNNTFSKEICWKISECYSLEKNNIKAVEYALEASELGLKEASEYVAHTYHEGRKEIEMDRKKSYRYYAIAAKQGMSTSLRILQKNAEEGVAEAQYYLGCEYYHEKQEIERAVYWCVKAEMQGHKKADGYLKTFFSAEILWEIARQYETSLQIDSENQKKSLYFYHRAAELKHKDAAFYLAQWYEAETSDVIDEKKIFDYYLIAEKQGHLEASAAIKRLERFMHTKKQITVSQLYASLYYNSDDASDRQARIQHKQLRFNQLKK